MSTIKRELYNHCFTMLQSRIASAREAMEQAQEAANSEDKSSAGDKYETSRAMGHIDKEMHARRLAQALEEMSFLEKINIDKPYSKITSGALVKTDKANFFIAISSGQIMAQGEKYIAISPSAPIAAAMMGKQSQDTFAFMNQFYTILYIE